MNTSTVILAFGLTLLAGLSTGIGGLMGIFTKSTNTKFLSVALGFSAGVMIYVSFVEILDKSFESLIGELGQTGGSWAAIAAFFAGMFFIALIDRLIPLDQNPHEIKTMEGIEQTPPKERKLMRMGLLTALAIGIHNFPEGLITFTATLKDPSLGVAIAIAIAIHNVPEGIAVAVPVYYGTGNRKKAFLYSFFSGLAEPIGALIGFVILMNIFSDVAFGLTFGFVGGIMVFIALDELLPTAREYGEAHLSIYGLIAGMMLMASSLLLLR